MSPAPASAPRRFGSRAGLLALAVLLFVAGALAALDVPFLAGRVNDRAGVIPADVAARIDGKLAAFERETGSQVVVLTVPSLEGDPIEDFSMRVVESWKLGRKGKDDGVLVLVAPGDRQMRIEVGYGLEARLTDLQSHRITDEVMAPLFKQGKMGEGIEAGVDAVLGLLRGDPSALPPERPAGSGQTDVGGSVVALGMLALFGFFALNMPGCMGWVVYVFLMPFWFGISSALFPMPVPLFVVGAWAVLYPLLRVFVGRRLGGSGGGRGGWGGWSSGGGGFGGFGGGGFSGGGFSGGGGGFSGGGGSFGGGGASGRW